MIPNHLDLSLIPNNGSPAQHCLSIGAGPQPIAGGRAEVIVASGSILVDLAWDQPLAQDLDVILTLPLPYLTGTAAWPLFHGQVEQRRGGRQRGWFHGSGGPVVARLDADRLAVPCCIADATHGQVLIGCDPRHAAGLTIAPGQATVAVRLHARAAVRHHRRRIAIAVVSSFEEAMTRYPTLVLPEVTESAAWTRDIRWNHYDFLGRNGSGWFADLTSISEMVAPVDRHRVAVCLHGWYGEIGEYGFDRVNHRMRDAWLAMPYAGRPEVIARDRGTGPAGLGRGGYHFRNGAQQLPVPMSVSELRRRLAFARDLGFKVGLYALTGLQTAGDPTAAIAAGLGLETRGHLWTGPDLIGPTYLRNPCHPGIRADFLAYIEALLESCGDLLDGLVMDEAYYVGYQPFAPEACPGYTELAQATLIEEMARRCHSYRSDLAFLTADIYGVTSHDAYVHPYCLYADGIWQDSHYGPTTWDDWRIPTWNRAAINCCWSPLGYADRIRFAVVRHDAPVPTSNGCFGDDRGPADYDASERAWLVHLWDTARNRERPRILPVTTALW